MASVAMARRPFAVDAARATRTSGAWPPDLGASGFVASPPAGEDEVDVSSEAPEESAGATSPASRAPAAAAEGHPSWRGGLAAIVKRYGDPIALAVVAILYLFWPSGLAPDRKWYGGVDDVVFIVLLAYLARRVIKRSPTLLDLPGVVSRAVSRALRRSP
jgi:hypothetical protein